MFKCLKFAKLSKFNLHKSLSLKYFSLIGLDMGGTNTVITLMEANGPRVIENAEGLRYSPSIISVNEDGTEVVSVVAKRQAIQNAKNSFYGTKYFFGRKYSDEFVQNMLKRFKFEIVKGDNDDILFKTEQGTLYTPSKVTTLYLKYVKDQADAFVGKPVKKIVMSLPKYIPEGGKEEIKTSVKEAGLEVITFIDESVSAALGYGLDKNENIKNVIVFNMGGTGFSLTSLARRSEIKEGEDPFEVKNEANDFTLSGDDIDKELVDFLLFSFKQQNKMDISNDTFALQRITEAAEKAKIELSLSQQVDISIPFLAANETGPKHLAVTMSRSKFEKLIDSFITRIKNNCEKFVKDNELKLEEIDDVILLGGVSRIPRIQEIIKQVFKKEPNKAVNPEEAAALGAGLKTTIIKLNFEEIKEMKTLPLSVGIESLGGVFSKLIQKDTCLPCKISRTFVTVYDNQPRVNINLYIGEREIAADNKHLGTLILNTPCDKKGKCKINLTVNININGDISITAKEELTKKSTSYSTKISGLTQDVVTDILEEAKTNLENDTEAREMSNIRISCDDYVYFMENILNNNSEELEDKNLDIDKLTELTQQLKEFVNANEAEKMLDIYELLISQTKGLRPEKRL